ncbi:tubby like protein 8 [Euphorbia peplus]|nr:tubby like protein 8 [Euphorbia peplus]
MSSFKKPVLMPLTQSSYNAVYVNPIVTESKHHHSGSDGVLIGGENKENNPIFANYDQENTKPSDGSVSVIPNKKKFSNMKSLSTNTSRILKPSSLQNCMQMAEPEKGTFKSLLWDFESENSTSSSLKIWDYSDSEAAPAASWSTLPNRTLLCRPLPLDIGRCTCIIVKEKSPQGVNGGSIYSLYTNEGQGRQNRKLAIAHHKRRKGKSVFTIAQNLKGITCSSDDSFVGNVTANFMGSQYHIWDQVGRTNSQCKQQRNPLLAVVTFVPTVVTCMGSYRSMRAFIPKHHSMQFKNNAQMQHINGLPKDWMEKMDKVHKLYSRTPNYNNFSKQYELDYRDRGRAGLKVQRSVKNFQLKLEENGKQTILQLGRVGKSKFVMDFRYPLSGYEAFCISLASIDSKLCCTL